ncbi:hypothetical protein D3C86_1484660 [compost metagenome]
MIAFSSPKRKSASDFANSVFPVPVGPRKKKEPIGCPGLVNPERDSNMASETTFTAWSWPITLFFNVFSMSSKRSRSSDFTFPAGIPVMPDTTCDR